VLFVKSSIEILVLVLDCINVDASNAEQQITLETSSEAATAADALVGSGDVWSALPRDADRDGNFLYTISLMPEAIGFIAGITFSVANVEQLSVFIQCRETPDGWTVANNIVSCNL